MKFKSLLSRAESEIVVQNTLEGQEEGKAEEGCSSDTATLTYRREKSVPVFHCSLETTAIYTKCTLKKKRNSMFLPHKNHKDLRG